MWAMAKAVVVDPKRGDVVLPIQKALHFQKFIDLVHINDTEYCIRVDENYQNVVDAWQVILNKINEYAKKGLYPINMTIEMRYVNSTFENEF